MNVPVINMEKKEESKLQLPEQFSEPISASLIARAVLTLQLNSRQPYGAKPEAGTRASSKLSRRRRNYRGSYGRGISRVPRKILTRRGRQMYWVGAQAPGTVGGRRAHPPKAFSIWAKKINRKENAKAIRSALAATMQRNLVEKHGHKVPENYPFIVSDSISSISKTKAALEAMQKLGLEAELERTSKKTIRAGKGKIRGRKYAKKTGPLIVVADKCELQNAATNISGVQVALVGELNAEMLAPGAVPGRLTLFTPSAISKMKKENMYS